MAKSKIEDIINATRIVNALDKRGRLAILRDLQAQGLEIAPMRCKVGDASTISAATVVGNPTVTTAKVLMTYTGGEK